MININSFKTGLLAIVATLFLLPIPKANAAWIVGFRNEHSNHYDPKVADMAATVFLGVWGVGMVASFTNPALLPIAALVGILDEHGNVSNAEIEKTLAQRHSFLNNDREALSSLADLVSSKTEETLAGLSEQKPQEKLFISREEIVKSVEMADFSSEQIDALVNDFK